MRLSALLEQINDNALFVGVYDEGDKLLTCYDGRDSIDSAFNGYLVKAYNYDGRTLEDSRNINIIIGG